LLLALPPAVLLVCIIVSDVLINLTERLPVCPFYQTFGLYCPACGNTRSITALLQGYIVQSLRYNITVIFLCLLGFAFYIEFLMGVCNKKIKIVPRGNAFIGISLTFFLLYYLLRNFFPFLTP
jgi:hypothetical protein